MDCACYLREGKVYIPTLGKMDQGFYREIEPVTVVDVSDTDALHAAFSETIARGTPKVPRLFRSATPPIVPKYAGVRSWKAFASDASTWGINERGEFFELKVTERIARAAGQKITRMSKPFRPAQAPVKSSNA